MPVDISPPQEFTITVLGRTLEHLGVQMYKRRDVAIAELVANSWDAGANNVEIDLPLPTDYDPSSSKIVITDDGVGMNNSQIQREYLVVGRNRRQDSGVIVSGRPVMGRKGIGKLAGFGVASKMTVTTWRDGSATTFTLDVDELTREAGETANVRIIGTIENPPVDVASASGTKIILTGLKQITAIDIQALREAIGRRFSRSVRGLMSISINGVLISEPNLDLEIRFPKEGYEEIKLINGAEIKYNGSGKMATVLSNMARYFSL